MVELFKEFFIDNYYKNKISYIPRYFLFNPLYPECDIDTDGELIEDESEYTNYHYCSYEYDINNETYDSYRNIDDLMFLEDIQNIFSQTFSQLNNLEEIVLRMRFGLGEIDTECTLDEIAKELGRSRERVRQIESSGIKKLKHPKVSRLLKTYIEDNGMFVDNFMDKFTFNRETAHLRYMFIADYIVNHFIIKNNENILASDYDSKYMEKYNLVLVSESKIVRFRELFTKALLENIRFRYIEINSNLHNNLIYKVLREIGIYHNYFIPENMVIKITLNNFMLTAIFTINNIDYVITDYGCLKVLE